MKSTDMLDKKRSHSSSRRKTRRSKSNNNTIRIFKQYRFEITALFLFSLGIFLLTEKLEIRSTVFHWVKQFFGVILHFIATIFEWIRFIIGNFENSDIVGSLLIIISIILVGHRYRIHLWKQYGAYSDCPKCESQVKRVHRTFLQKLFGIVMMVRVLNYKCKKCGYKYPVITPKK